MLLHASGVFKKTVHVLFIPQPLKQPQIKLRAFPWAVEKYLEVLCWREKWLRYFQNSAGICWFFSPLVSYR